MASMWFQLLHLHIICSFSPSLPCSLVYFLQSSQGGLLSDTDLVMPVPIPPPTASRCSSGKDSCLLSYENSPLGPAWPILSLPWVISLFVPRHFPSLLSFLRHTKHFSASELSSLGALFPCFPSGHFLQVSVPVSFSPGNLR